MNSWKYKIFIIVAFICSFIFLRFYMGSNNRWKEYYHKLNYEGTITDKFKDSHQKYQGVIIVDSDYSNRYLVSNDSVYNFIQVGDYIVKKSGESKSLLVRDGDTITYYPKIYGKYIN